MKRGLTLVEIMTASVILSIGLLSLFVVNSSSHRMTMDSYFELLALQIAQEPLEVFKVIGHPACMNQPNYPIGKTVAITTENGRYPVEACMFERTITIDHSTAPLYVATVSVTPLPNTKARLWMRTVKSCIVLKGIIPVYK